MVCRPAKWESPDRNDQSLHRTAPMPQFWFRYLEDWLTESHSCPRPVATSSVERWVAIAAALQRLMVQRRLSAVECHLSSVMV